VKISNKVIECLKKSGWNSSRNIDITIYEEALKIEGYKLSESIIEFLKQFGGMEIIVPAFRRPDDFDKIFIDPIKAINGIYRGNVIGYEERTGESMVVIGETYDEQLVLLMSETGKIYAAFDHFLTKLGDNVYEAIENLCESKDTPDV
jgi:hypothetical protein